MRFCVLSFISSFFIPCSSSVHGCYRLKCVEVEVNAALVQNFHYSIKEGSKMCCLIKRDESTLKSKHGWFIMQLSRKLSLGEFDGVRRVELCFLVLTE